MCSMDDHLIKHVSPHPLLHHLQFSQVNDLHAFHHHRQQSEICVCIHTQAVAVHGCQWDSPGIASSQSVFVTMNGIWAELAWL